MSRVFSYSFVWVILACGLVVLVFIFGNFAVLGLHRHPPAPRKYVTEGDIDRGRKLIEVYNCGSCHVIPGVRSAKGRVGPRLTGIASQTYIGGVLANEPEKMVAWLMNPQAVSPNTAMPNLHISHEEAQHMAAYLYTLTD